MSTKRSHDEAEGKKGDEEDKDYNGVTEENIESYMGDCPTCKTDEYIIQGKAQCVQCIDQERVPFDELCNME
jgi:hypothetical protein